VAEREYGLSTKTISTCKPEITGHRSAITAQVILSPLLFFSGRCCQSFPVTLVNSFHVPKVITLSSTDVKLWTPCSYDVIRESLREE